MSKKTADARTPIFAYRMPDHCRDIAERRVHELSKPGAPVTMTAYINKLIEADGKKHPAPKKR